VVRSSVVVGYCEVIGRDGESETYFKDESNSNLINNFKKSYFVQDTRETAVHVLDSVTGSMHLFTASHSTTPDAPSRSVRVTTQSRHLGAWVWPLPLLPIVPDLSVSERLSF
jgi:hypothetical protein